MDGDGKDADAKGVCEPRRQAGARVGHECDVLHGVAHHSYEAPPTAACASGWSQRRRPMISRERYTMAELVERTGTTPATVRHYLELGLLPRPHRVATNRFLYDSRHEQAIRLIRLLRERRQLP